MTSAIMLRELGVAGAIQLFLLYGYLLYQMYVIVKESSNVFGRHDGHRCDGTPCMPDSDQRKRCDKCNSEYRCHSSFHKLGRFRTSHDHGRVWYVYRNQKAADEKSVSEAFE